MKLDTLRQLYLEQLKDLCQAERLLVNALSEARDAAECEQLRGVFAEHLTQTKQQVVRLETILGQHGLTLDGEHCQAMEGLISESHELLAVADSAVRDAALISAAQKIEHYEIGCYGCLEAYARIIGDRLGAELLHTTLAEERATDQKLTRLAEQSISKLAASGAKHTPV